MRHPILLFAIAPLMACHEASAPDEPRQLTPTIGSATVNPTCDVNWDSLVSGAWSDASKWDTGNVPMFWDSVCITVPGSYSVVVTNGWASEVHVGDGQSNIQLMELPSPYGPTYRVLETSPLKVRSGAGIQLRDLNDIENIELDAGAALNFAGATALVDVQQLTLSGHVHTVAGRDVSVLLDTSVQGHADLLNATIVGSGRIYINGSVGQDDGLTWSGGSLGTLTPSPADPIVMMRGLNLDIEHANAPSGAIDVDPDGEQIEITGVIGSAARVRLRRAQWNSSAAVDLGDNAGSPLDVEGQLEFTDIVGGGIAVRGSVENRGTMVFGPGRVSLRPDTVQNSGTISIVDSVHMTTGAIQNAGSVQVAGLLADLVIAGGEFVANPGGTFTGELSLVGGGRLRGSGTVDRVSSIGGIVTPGDITDPTGRLTINRLVLDATSRVISDVGDVAASSYDDIHVTTHLTRGGSFELQTVGSIPPGLCGQSWNAMTMAKGATVTGTFSQYTGLALAPDRAWRVVPQAVAYTVVGYDPSKVLSVSATNAGVNEGGIGATVRACLGGPGPTAPVTLTSTSRFGQSTITPNPVTFTLANWALPQPLTVTAIDDTIAEPPLQRDSIRLRLTSTDPVYTGIATSQLAIGITDNDVGPDLSLAVVTAPAAVTANQTFEIRYRVTNNGPAASTGSAFTVGLAGMTYVGNTAQVSCPSTTGTLQCTVGALSSGAQVEFVVVYRAGVAGSYANTARIAGVEYDPVSGNNAVVVNVTVN